MLNDEAALKRLCGVMVLSLVVVFGLEWASADTGHLKASRIAEGNAVGGVRTASVTNGAISVILSAKDDRASVACFNAGANAIHIGSAAANVASLQVLGIPVLASSTLTMYGYRGALSAVTGIATTSTSTVYCLEGLTQ